MVSRSAGFLARQEQFLRGGSRAFRPTNISFEANFTQADLQRIEQQRINQLRGQRADEGLLGISREQAQANARIVEIMRRRDEAISRGASESELRSLGEELERVGNIERAFIGELQQLRDQAKTGDFLAEDLIGFARERALTREQGGRSRAVLRKALETGGLSRAEASQVVKQGSITQTQASKLNQQARDFFGITLTETPAESLPPQARQSRSSEFQSPTALEESLGMSLVPELRNLSPEEFNARQSFDIGSRGDFVERFFDRLPTTGKTRQSAEEAEVNRLASEFQSLTADQAFARASRGDKGFVGMSTPEGSIISFDVSAFEPEIRSAGRRAEGKDFILGNLPTSIGLLLPNTDISDIIGAKQRRGGDIILGASSFLTKTAEFTVELPFQGGTRKLDQGSIKLEKVDLPIFDQGIFKTIKEQPTSMGSFLTELQLTGGLGGVAIGSTSTKLFDSGLPLGRRATEFTKETLGSFATYPRPSPRVIIPEVKFSDTSLRQIIPKGDRFEFRDFLPSVDDSGAFSFSIGVLKRKPSTDELIGFGKQFNVVEGLQITKSGDIRNIRVVQEIPFVTKSTPSRVRSFGKRGTQIEFDQDLGFLGDSFSPSGKTREAGFSRRVGDKFFQGSSGERFLFGEGRTGFRPDRKFIGLESSPDFADDFSFFRGASGKRKPSLPRQGQDLQQLTKQAENFVIPKVNLPKQDLTSPDLTGDAFSALRQQQSTFAGLGLFERTDSTGIRTPTLSQRQLLFVPELDFEKISFRGGFGNTSLPLSRSRQGILTIPRQGISDLIGFAPREIPRSRTGLGNSFVDRQIIERPTIPNNFNFRFDFTGGGFFPFRGFIPPLGFDEFPKLGARGKRKLKRTPSFISILSGFESPRQILGEETGLVARPLISDSRRRKR